MSDLVIASTPLTTDSEGRYNLNALHRASGTSNSKRPPVWLENKTTKGLVAAIEAQSIYPTLVGGVCLVICGGTCQGTYAVKELALAYAQWLSPECHRQVIAQMLSTSDLLARVLDALDDFDLDDLPPDRFVYAAQDSEGRLKIGISKDPAARVRQLNIGHPDELKLVYTRQATLPGYGSEIEAHNLASAYHIRSEWFGAEALPFIQ